MNLQLSGKTALVMGSSMGIGKAIAKMLIEEGARVAICARNIEKLNQTAQEIRAELAIPCDLTQKNTAKILTQKVIEKFGKLDILVTNTGGPPKGTFEEITPEQWELGFQSLWLSVVESIQTALPSMKKNQWGRILLITSTAAKQPLPGLTVSNGLRAGLLGLTNSLSQEVAQYGITVNAILPGYTQTERLAELGIGPDRIAAVPARRTAKTEEVAALTVFLASEQAAYITGQAIACDGGSIKGI